MMLPNVTTISLDSSDILPNKTPDTPKSIKRRNKKSLPLTGRKKPEYLPDNFVPSAHDVVCGRGKIPNAHVGNQRFKITIKKFLDRYIATGSSKKAKSAIVSEIAAVIQENGMFVKLDAKTRRWYQVTTLLMRERISQAFRDELSSHYRSSKQSRRQKRQRQLSLVDESLNFDNFDCLSFLDDEFGSEYLAGEDMNLVHEISAPILDETPLNLTRQVSLEAVQAV